MAVSVMRRAAVAASGFGKVLPIFGARTAASAATLPLPLRSRKRAKERAPAKPRMSERPPIPAARRAAMKARTSCGVSLERSFSFGAPPRCSAMKARNCPTSR
jgi:hypothetical protein